MKSIMAMAKGKGEGMEGLAEMMKGAGMDLPEGMDMEKMMKMAEAGENGEPPTPEELKESIKMMKQLIDGGMVSPSELKQIKKEFRDNMGTDVEDLVKMAEEQVRAERVFCGTSNVVAADSLRGRRRRRRGTESSTRTGRSSLISSSKC